MMLKLRGGTAVFQIEMGRWHGAGVRGVRQRGGGRCGPRGISRGVLRVLKLRPLISVILINAVKLNLIHSLST